MDNLRQLALSFEYQLLYARMKEGLSVELFNNKKDFSELQLAFLYWLEIYHGLYGQLSQSKFLNEDVIKNQTRCDAYLKFNKKYSNDDSNENNNMIVRNKINTKKKSNMTTVPGIPAVCYKPRG